MKTAAILLMTLIIGVAYSAESLRQKNSTPLEAKADQIMSAVDNHCEAKANATANARRRRQVGGRGGNPAAESTSTDVTIRSIVLNIIKDCLESEPENLPTTPPPVDDGPCVSPYTVNLTEFWRQDSKGSDIKPIDGDYNCDRDLQNNQIWFRFTGAAGSRMRDSCVPKYSCGSHASFWTDAPMPTKVGEIRQVPIYGAWANDCDWYTWPTSNPLTVQRCSSKENDFVYKVHGTQSCNWSFCGMP